MADFRENYFEAREIVAQELKEKYNLVESYKDDNRLTLDSSNHSIHLTFYVPDGDDVSISEKGKEPGNGNSFRYFLLDMYPNNEQREKVLKTIYKNAHWSPFTYSKESIKFNFKIKLNFLQRYFPTFFI